MAYRFFATSKRRFIVADTPGHEQYTRNMITGASTAHAAVLLIDACKGVLVQTKRHSRIISMLGIRHVALAVNKMDLVNWSQLVCDEIALSYARFAKDLGFDTISVIPVSALEGHNIVEAGHVAMSWYDGPSLLQWLETIKPEDTASLIPSFCQCSGLTGPISTSAGFGADREWDRQAWRQRADHSLRRG